MSRLDKATMGRARMIFEAVALFECAGERQQGFARTGHTADGYQ